VYWATTAAAAGLPFWLIKVMGRWSSDTYQTYLHCPSNLIYSVLQLLAHTDAANSHCESLTTLSNQYYKVSRLYPVLYAMNACPSYHILSISPQSFAWAIRMIPKVVWQHTTFVLCIATNYYCAVHCCHFLLVLYITGAIVCLCCMLPPTFV